MNPKEKEEKVLDFILRELLHVDSENVYGFNYVDMGFSCDHTDILCVARIKYFGEEYRPKNEFYMFTKNNVFIVEQQSNKIKKLELSADTKKAYDRLEKRFESKKAEVLEK